MKEIVFVGIKEWRTQFLEKVNALEVYKDTENARRLAIAIKIKYQNNERSKMKLRNKKTGKIIDTVFVDHGDEWELHNVYTDEDTQTYNSLAELNAEWEDAPEEPKEWWYIDIHGPHKVTNNDEYYQQVKAASKEIGNYFETKEEAERAVEKLKAWKRLFSLSFKFKGWRTADLGADKYYFVITAESDGAGKGDLDLLFSGEDD